MRPSQEKDARLAAKADAGERMRLFAEDPIVTGWFADAIAKQTNVMVGAASSGDAQAMMHAGLIVKVLGEVQSFMANTAAAGSRAAQELHKKRQKDQS